MSGDAAELVAFVRAWLDEDEQTARGMARTYADHPGYPPA